MNIKFANEAALERFRKCREMSRGCKWPLDRKICDMMAWMPVENTVTIACDFEENSFLFQETDPEGKKGLCGGIIFHGSHDNGGDGSAPTFSVNMEPVDGYSIHT